LAEKSILLIMAASLRYFSFPQNFNMLSSLTIFRFTQWVNAKLDKTLLFSGWKGSVDIIF
jgi:hypothetical protein